MVGFVGASHDINAGVDVPICNVCVYVYVCIYVMYVYM